ncbi:hypothetical protein Clacol_000449 [Clathrus columnatus]|uniref:tRNA-guanosine(34) queuine transglycosylase n=1 Tax=Clathrus columnatus TaxID=1419009 RepID=A0AAV4ZYK2_9AGAM|nr:hypothetical protein Clacol_000449 [Clathrus columnatus]
MAHGVTWLPTFMPVATQAAIKGLTYQQMEELGVTLILNNTYHLNLRPGMKVIQEAGGAHKFQGWRKNLLTDSGGFQLVSLSKFTKITEEGALFASPFTGEPTLLTPEESMSIQHTIGADIIMQLDDVVPSLTTGPRVEEAMWRSVRWLDRCIAQHKKTGQQHQNLFAIIQGGLNEELRRICLNEMVKRKDSVAGYAIGGLSGGEAKGPRYSMGIGFAEDLLVCIALGVDMADCVFPTRTARFGVALTRKGAVNLHSRNALDLKKYRYDMDVIEEDCPCPTCRVKTSKAFLHHNIGIETAAAHALTQHNVVFQARLMGDVRDAILKDEFPIFLKNFFKTYYDDFKSYPRWIVNALRSVSVDLLEEDLSYSILDEEGVKWDRAAK